MSIQKIIATQNQYIIYATIFSISSLNLLSADINPNISLGFQFILFNIFSNLSLDTLFKSVPFGINLLNIPLQFSFLFAMNYMDLHNTLLSFSHSH